MLEIEVLLKLTEKYFIFHKIPHQNMMCIKINFQKTKYVPHDNSKGLPREVKLFIVIPLRVI